MNKIWGVHWFRRDLRVAGNAVLRENAAQTGGRTLGLFCFDAKFLARSDFSHNRFAFFLKTMAALREEMRELGGDLLVVDALPAEAFARLLAFAAKREDGRPQLVSFNRDYEPFARQRDEAVETYLRGEGVDVLTARDHLLFEPEEVRRGPGADAWYKVYSPWSRRWATALAGPEGQSRIQAQLTQERPQFTLTWSKFARDLPLKDAYAQFERENNAHVKIEIPAAGHAAALEELARFKPKLKNYKAKRDIPAAEATSRVSMFIKNGSLTVPQILGLFKLNGQDFATETGPTRFTKELAWREFYYAIMWFRPDLERVPFNLNYKDIEWPGSDAHFARWCAGTTGVPIVDAGMRELAQTGWMTNRLRIITSTFLIKDLLVDWRKGENHFMKLLLDGDLAANNGNWQWSSSTGSDPNPYFRVLNPWLQSLRFDPEGSYIRRWVPELKDCPAKDLHDPDAVRDFGGYPKPLVDHRVQKPLAIALYKKK